MDVIKVVFFTVTAVVLTPLLMQCMDESVTQNPQEQEESPITILLEESGKKIVHERYNGQDYFVYYKKDEGSDYKEVGRRSYFQCKFLSLPTELKQYIVQLMATKSLACNFEYVQKIPYTIPSPDGLQTPDISHLICSITFSGDAEKVITGCTDKMIRLWDAKTGMLLKTIEGYPARVVSVDSNYDGTVILSLCYDAEHGKSSVWAYNAKAGKLTRGLQNSKERMSEAVLSPDGLMVFTKLWYPSKSLEIAVIWDNAMENRLITMDLHVQTAAFSSNSKRFFLIGHDGIGQIWDMEKKSLVMQLEGIRQYLQAATLTIAFSPDTSKVLIGYNDGMIQVWNTHTGELIKTVSNYKGMANTVGFTPDGKTIFALVPSTMAAFLFDAETGNLLGSVKSFSGYNQSVVCSPDGSTLLMGSIAETIYVKTTIFCDAYNWILNKVNCYQAWLIAQATEARRGGKPLVIQKGSLEYKLFMSLPEDIRNYLIKWYAISADIQDYLLELCSLPDSSPSLHDKILNKINCYHTWLIVKAGDAQREGKTLVIQNGSFEHKHFTNLPEEIRKDLMERYLMTISDSHSAIVQP